MYILRKVVIIEDNSEVVEAVSLALQIRWPEIEIISTPSGNKGAELVEINSPDMVILDLGLPDASGFDVLKSIRSFSAVPIVILTVRGDEVDVVRGLELGADEYIVKPFRQMELISRIKALTRRESKIDLSYPIVSGEFAFYPEERYARYMGREINFTHSESVILMQLIQRAGRVVSRNTIAEQLWGCEYLEDLSAIKVYIRRLREKIERDPDNPKLILTRHGLGYLFAKLD